MKIRFKLIENTPQIIRKVNLFQSVITPLLPLSVNIQSIDMLPMANKNTHKNFQLKQNQIDQSMKLSIWGVECGEDITKVPHSRIRTR